MRQTCLVRSCAAQLSIWLDLLKTVPVRDKDISAYKDPVAGKTGTTIELRQPLPKGRQLLDYSLRYKQTPTWDT